MDSESTRLLRDLRAALLQAMTESREMRRVLDRLRECGWSAYVVIDESEDGDDGALAEARPKRTLHGELEMTRADLTLLRSLGIDPRPEPRGVQ